MTGFEPGSSGFGSDRAANCATTTAHPVVKFVFCCKIPLVLIFCDTLDQNRLDHLKIYLKKKCIFFKMKRLRLKLQMMHPLEKLYGLFLFQSTIGFSSVPKRPFSPLNTPLCEGYLSDHFTPESYIRD